MSKTILDIGGVPVFIGQYVAGAYYHHLHRVTHLGSEFQAKVDGYLAEPVVLQDGWQHPVWNEEEWQVISNGTDAMVIANTVNRVYTITETAWANLQERVEDYKTFCQHHLGWAVDVVEDGYVPPVPPEPTPDSGSVIQADGSLVLSGTIQADGSLILNGTINNEGVLTL